MTDGAIIASTAAGAEYEMANALKASGAIVSVEPRDFETILRKTDTPLVVQAQGGFLSTRYHYLTPYRGLIFYTKTQTPLSLPRGTELVTARKIWVPS